MDHGDRLLDEAKANLIRCWGEMAPYWGISRTMAEVHALLFICSRPLCTDEIMAALSISRGNAWTTFESIARQRKRREIEPIIQTISNCCQLARQAESSLSDPRAGEEALKCRTRLEEMLDFLSVMNRLFESFLEAGPAALRDLSVLLGGRENADEMARPTA
jgi:DNA-binding transcriptional regulator GbsR (MarR family)